MTKSAFNGKNKLPKAGRRPKLPAHLMPASPGGWALYNSMGFMKEAQEREKRRMPK